MGIDELLRGRKSRVLRQHFEPFEEELATQQGR